MALLGAAVAFPQVPILTQSRIQDDFGQYSFSYSSPTGISATSRGALKPLATSNGLENVLVQQGAYSYYAPDGQLYTVRYIADENGEYSINQLLIRISKPFVLDIQLMTFHLQIWFRFPTNRWSYPNCTTSASCRSSICWPTCRSHCLSNSWARIWCALKCCVDGWECKMFSIDLIKFRQSHFKFAVFFSIVPVLFGVVYLDFNKFWSSLEFKNKHNSVQYQQFIAVIK